MLGSWLLLDSTMDTKLAVAKLDEHNFLERRRDELWYLIAKKLWDPASEGEVDAVLPTRERGSTSPFLWELRHCGLCQRG